MINVKDFGALGDGSDDSLHIQAAINTAGALGGGYVYFPPAPSYYNIGETSLTVPARVLLMFDKAQLRYRGSNFAIIAGSADSVDLSYGIALDGLNLILLSDDAKGIKLVGTAGAALRDAYIEGHLGKLTRTNVGVCLDGGTAACIFTELSNVTCNHMTTGLLVTSPKGGMVTTLTAVGFRSLGDTIYGVTDSVGIDIKMGNGNGFVFIGGNLESCATGIRIDNPAGEGCGSIMFNGMRFESNTLDVKLGIYETGISFYGCMGLDNVDNRAGTGFGRHTFWGNLTSKVTPFALNTIYGHTQIRTDTNEVPLQLFSPNASPTNRFEINANYGAETYFAIDASGHISTLGNRSLRILAGSGSPEGTVTANIGSLYLNVDGGTSTTLYVKTSGSGNTGWTAK